MALTATHQVSGVYQPSNNDNLWVIEESSTGITSNFNFKFLCDVKNTSGTLLSRLKVPIYFGSGNKGVVNISKVLSAYTKYDWNFNDSASSGCTNSAFDYSLSFGYEYSTGATSDIQVSTGVTNVTGNTVWNAALHPLDFLNYSQNDYLMASGSTANFLTSLSSKRIYADQKEWLYALHNSAIGYLSVNWSDVTRNFMCRCSNREKEEIDEAAVTFGQSALADPGVAIADMVINNMEEDPTQRKVGSIYKELNCLCNPTRAKRPGEICSRLGKWCVVNANQIFSSIIGE